MQIGWEERGGGGGGGGGPAFSSLKDEEAEEEAEEEEEGPPSPLLEVKREESSVSQGLTLSPCYRHTFLLFVFGTTTVFSHAQKVLTFYWELCGKVSLRSPPACLQRMSSQGSCRVRLASSSYSEGSQPASILPTQ